MAQLRGTAAPQAQYGKTSGHGARLASALFEPALKGG
jgi:hypothetical protein